MYAFLHCITGEQYNVVVILFICDHLISLVALNHLWNIHEYCGHLQKIQDAGFICLRKPLFYVGICSRIASFVYDV